MTMRAGLILFGFTALTLPVLAQNAGYNWVLTKGASANGDGSKLDINIPQSNAPLGRLTCVDNRGKGTYTVLTLAANTGATKSGAPAQISVTTPRGKHDFAGLVVDPATGGGIKGVTFSVANNHPIWPSLAYGPHIDYQVKGNVGSRLVLTSARGKIAMFANACGFAPPGLPNNAAATPQVPVTAPVTVPKAPVRAPVQPVQPVPVQPPAVQPQVPALPFYQTSPGRSAWRNRSYRIKTNSGTEKVYTANVTNGGLALHAYCVGGQNLQFFITRSGRKYPEFLKRVRQAMATGPNFDFAFAEGKTYPVQMFLDSEGDIATRQSVDAGSNFVEEFLRNRSLSITKAPFGASFQLRASKKAICKVVNRCGATSSFCGKKSRSPSGSASKRCRPRSVYVPGRGCILRRYAR